MSSRLEMIEMLRERTHVTYEEAKEALEKCNDDVVEALIYLERNHKVKSGEEKKASGGYGFIRAIKNLIRKGNRTKLVISKNGNSVLRIPVTLLVIMTILAPHFTLIGVVIALFTDHRFGLVKEDGSNVEFNRSYEKASSKAVIQKNEFAE